MSNQFIIIIIILALILMGVTISEIDFNDLCWASNKSNYLGITSNVLVIIAMLKSYKSHA